MDVWQIYDQLVYDWVRNSDMFEVDKVDLEAEWIFGSFNIAGTYEDLPSASKPPIAKRKKKIEIKVCKGSISQPIKRDPADLEEFMHSAIFEELAHGQKEKLLKGYFN